MTRHAFRSVCTPVCGVFCAAVLVGHPVLAVESPRAALGTLFYTPVQRQEISRARQSNPEVDSSSTVRLSGVVRRNDRKGTVWVNHKALPEGGANAPRLLGLDAVVDGKRLRVGESLDTLSGARSDLVAPGAVTLQSQK